MAPATVYLHVGMHKTGTTFLQNLWNLNREDLLAQGVCYPGGRGGVAQSLAAADLQGKRPRGHADGRVAGAWDATVAAVEGSGAETALISHESLGFCNLRQARKAVSSFSGEVRVIVTARDLGRVLVSQWQEEVKNDRVWTWREYADAAADPDRATQLPAVGFWQRADPVRVCDTWAAAVGSDRVHVVTVPLPGAPPDTLVRRLGDVVGFDPDRLPEEPVWNNEMVGAAGTEVLRRVNVELAGTLNQAQHTRAVRRTLVPMLVRGAEHRRLELPAAEFPWVETRAREIVATLRERGYDVTGDLDELVPRPASGGGDTPESLSTEEMLDTAVRALALLTERYATSWWSRKGESIEGGDEREGAAGRARAGAYRVKEGLVNLTERNAFAAKTLGWALRAEQHKVAKARAKADKEDR